MAPDRSLSDNSPRTDDRGSLGSGDAVDGDISHQPSEPHLSQEPSLALSKPQSEFGCYARNSSSSAAETESTNLTVRGVIVGSIIGVIICFSNTYFGLQTGWVSGMAMPASLIGFAFFKTISKQLAVPFTPVENVLVQTVAGAVGTMPLGCGFVGVIPALEFLLEKEEGAPIELGTGRLMLWSVGICLFGVVFAVPLRRQVIIREKLKFPSGSATALMIGVLHGSVKHSDDNKDRGDNSEQSHALLQRDQDEVSEHPEGIPVKVPESDHRSDWKTQIKLLAFAFIFSASYTLFQYFVPQVRRIPILGTTLASAWLWTLNPSPAYVGQGIIMGPATTIHMLIGAIIGWGILSPLAKHRGYAPGKTSDWENGSKGWIVWVSLAIMLADAIINLGWLILKPLIYNAPNWVERLKGPLVQKLLPGRSNRGYTSLSSNVPSAIPISRPASDGPDPGTQSAGTLEDAPPHHLVSTRTILILFPLTLLFCILCIQLTFGAYISIPLTGLSTLVAVLLSIMGVRALGETDLNPVSGISKLTQLVFALVIPPRLSKHHNHAIIINLIAGAVSESGALQAGDMMQDLKAGHLIGASPKAQFYGQLIGSVVGAVVSAAVYKLYVMVYTVPGDLFQVPTAFVWIFTARLVTGQGLPPMAGQYALFAGIIFGVLTCTRIYLSEQAESSPQKAWHPYIPGGIAVAVGMYNTPSFTLARTIGGLINWWWVRRGKTGPAGGGGGGGGEGHGDGEAKVIVLASGLILGEGVISILNLGLASLEVPHL